VEPSRYAAESHETYSVRSACDGETALARKAEPAWQSAQIIQTRVRLSREGWDKGIEAVKLAGQDPARARDSGMPKISPNAMSRNAPRSTSR